MSNFDLNEEGSGFALSGDWNALLEEANAHEEVVGEMDTASYFQEDTPEEPQATQEASREIPVPPTSEEEPSFTLEEEPTPDETVEASPVAVDPFAPPTYDGTPETVDNFMSAEDVPESTPTPAVEDPFQAPSFEADLAGVVETNQVVEESPAAQAPETHVAHVVVPVAAEQEHAAKGVTPRIKVPTLADELLKVRQIVRVVDAYRSLNGDEKMVASQFIAAGELVEDEGEFIVRVLNVDPMLTITMRALQEAKKLDDVERSFYVIELADDVFYNLGDLVSVFAEDDMNASLGRGKYARALVRNIEKLDSKAMNFVEATAKVLAAAAEEN